MAIKTFADWAETVPGFVEADLGALRLDRRPAVSVHDAGGCGHRWVSCAGLRDKQAQTVLAALHRLHEGLPFRVLGVDFDSGSEFLNRPLVDYCAAPSGSRSR